MVLRTNHPQSEPFNASRWNAQDSNEHAAAINANTAAVAAQATALGNKVDKSVITAKGDIIVGSGPGGLAVVPTSGASAGDVLTFDPSAPYVAKWAPPIDGDDGAASAGWELNGDGIYIRNDNAIIDGGEP